MLRLCVRQRRRLSLVNNSIDLFEAHLNLGRALSLEHDATGAAVHYRKAATSPDPEIQRAAADGLKNLGLQ